MTMRSIVLVVYNVRSAHNVGSILRTADGLGIAHVYLCGYTPYPHDQADTRLPHLAVNTSRQIRKTALGAENSVLWHHQPDIKKLVNELRAQDYRLVALEQTDKAIDLGELKLFENMALIVGSEVGGLPRAVLNMCDEHVCIPMFGKKESFNVAVATAIALYHLSHIT
ncbi:MAG: TrmH family RNA methyltransferase [Patescibacteria group bacterium]